MNHSLAIVFDIDDTLYLENDYARSGFAAVGQWASRWIDPRFADLCQQHFDAGERGSIFNSALRDVGREPTPELIASLVEIYRTHTPRISLEPDALEALTRLRRLGIPLAVVSDGPATSQSRKAEALGLDRFVAPIVLTGLWGAPFSKPSPWAYEQVAAAIPALSYIYVGDNPRKDFTAPRQLNWLTARIRRAGGLRYCLEDPDPPPTYQFADCSPLFELASRLLINGSNR